MKSCLLCLLLCLILAPGAAAQQGPAPKPETATAEAAKPEAKDKEAAELEATTLQQRGLGLIRQAAEEAATLDDRRSGARILAAAADLLWERDQDQARQLFEQAFETALAHYRETKDDNRQKVSESSSVGRADMRMEVIRLVGRRDSKLARQFTEQYIEEKKRELQARAGEKRGNDRLFGSEDPGAGDLLGTAATVLESDPKTAVELARRAFTGGVPQGAPSFLSRLGMRDRAAADQLFLGALERIARDPAVPPGQLLLLSAYPFGEGRVWASDGESTNSYGFGAPKDFAPDAQLIGRFLQTALAVVARTADLNPAVTPEAPSRQGAGLFTARLLEPKVAQYAPAMLDEWRVQSTKLTNLAADKSRDGIDRTLQDVTREGRRGPAPDTTDRVKELLDRAQQTSDFAQRDDLYQNAAMEAQRGGDGSRALEIAGRISDAEYKQKVRAWINFNAANNALGEGRLDEARRLASELDATDERAYLFFQIAAAALKEKDRGRAAELLTEATGKALEADNTPAKVRALVGIANLYAGFDPVRGFEVVTEAVKTANKISDYSPDQAQLVRVVARRGARGAMTSVNTVEGFDLGKTLQSLARADFERALGLARALESRPLRLHAQIAVAATLVDKKLMAQAQ